MILRLRSPRAWIFQPGLPRRSCTTATSRARPSMIMSSRMNGCYFGDPDKAFPGVFYPLLAAAGLIVTGFLVQKHLHAEVLIHTEFYLQSEVFPEFLIFVAVFFLHIKKFAAYFLFETFLDCFELSVMTYKDEPKSHRKVAFVVLSVCSDGQERLFDVSERVDQSCLGIGFCVLFFDDFRRSTGNYYAFRYIFDDNRTCCND